MQDQTKRNTHQYKEITLPRLVKIKWILIRLTLSVWLLVQLSCQGYPQADTSASLVYNQQGKGDTTLLFVHGWGINSRYWDAQIAHFQNRYTVIAVDLAGHGYSEALSTEMTIEQYATDLVQLVESLDLRDIILVGHSMAGNINLRAYQKFPERIIGFIGVDNFQVIGFEPPPQEQGEIKLFFDKMKQNYLKTAVEFANGMLFSDFTSNEHKARVIQDILHVDSVLAVSTLASLAQEYAVEMELLQKLKVPLELIVSEGSLLDESSHKALCKAGFQYWTYSHAGHYPMIEIPETFNKLLQLAITRSNR